MLMLGILDYSNKWNQLQYFEAYYVKSLSPTINVGLKISEQLKLV